MLGDHLGNAKAPPAGRGRHHTSSFIQCDLYGILPAWGFVPPVSSGTHILPPSNRQHGQELDISGMLPCAGTGVVCDGLCCCTVRTHPPPCPSASSGCCAESTCACVGTAHPRNSIALPVGSVSAARVAAHSMRKRRNHTVPLLRCGQALTWGEKRQGHSTCALVPAQWLPRWVIAWGVHRVASAPLPL